MIEIRYLSLALVSLPLLATLVTGLLRNAGEKTISAFVQSFNITTVILTAALIYFYLAGAENEIELDFGAIYSSVEYEFRFILLIDNYSVLFTALISFLSGAVMFFSRRYMHREPGYVRFFAVLFLF